MNPVLSSRTAPTSVRWRIVTLLMTFSFMAYFNRVSISTIATDLIHEFHISEIQMCAIVSSMLLPYTMCTTSGGWLSNRSGPRALMFDGVRLAVVRRAHIAGRDSLGSR